MTAGLANQPRLLRGALVDSNILSIPPLIVPFQYNPVEVRRRRRSVVRTPPSRQGREDRQPASEALGEAQTITVEPETISMDLRLDATDDLESGDPITGEFGVLPALSALEMMIVPKSQSLFAGVLGLSIDFGFGERTSTPVLIFVWGRQRVNAVRITDLDIQEVEYAPNLNPTRVVVSVDLQVIGGDNPFNTFTQAQREILAALNLRDAPDLLGSVIPF